MKVGADKLFVTDVTASDHSQKHPFEELRSKNEAAVNFDEEKHETTWMAGNIESLVVNYLKRNPGKEFPVITDNLNEIKYVEIITQPEEEAGFKTAFLELSFQERKIRVIQVFTNLRNEALKKR